MNNSQTTTGSGDDYVTVVTVEEITAEIKNEEKKIVDDEGTSLEIVPTKASQFVTVLSINGDADVDTEVVNVHRRTNERLGFGLKFQGGTKNNEKVEKLYIQSCADDSPASRARATWGELKEGDEILEINGISVRTLTRIQCVQKLKDGLDPLKLLIKQGKSTTNGEKSKKKVPPPPPPVPPRKLPPAKKLPTVKIITTSSTTSSQELTPPPEAEFYLNLFEQNERKASESDGDSASTLSTVIDKFSLCSSMSMSSISESEYEANVLGSELAKVLKPFQLLEKEFQLETTTKFDILKPLEVKVIQKHEPKDYENVDVKSVVTSRQTVYENVTPPTPKPRQNINNNNNVNQKVPAPRTREFNTIQTWLADATEIIHECPAVEKKSTPPISTVKKNSVFDNLDMEEGEKLGPPELLALPGPSEVYFNFPWAVTTLPTIGEEGEGDSSIETNIT